MQSDAIATFDYHPRTRVVFGPGSVDQVGKLAAELGGRRVLIVTDPGIVAAGHSARVEQLLQKSGLGVVIYDRVRENPTTRDVEQCVQAAREAGIDLFAGLGGGSSMDTAKACNLILTNGGQMRDYWGVGKATKPMLPLIAIPTTAGTGSECQSAALIADESTHQKMACLDPKVAARVAILDPVLTISQPARVTACTGIDAIAHAVETAVTKKRNPLSTLYAREAFRLAAGSFARVLEDPLDLEARGRMLLGAAFAGTAIENSMLGAAHSAANPLTAHFDIIHGQAVGMMLPAVVRFNASEPAARHEYAELVATIPAGEDTHPEEAAGPLVRRLEDLLDRASMPRSLAECGIPRTAIPMLAAEAAKQWTAIFNPRKVTAEDFVSLYEAAFEPRASAEL
ncbi:MAG: alcohol dehydrogenase [Verrucomicrobiota bacterium]|jgi:alcohol dehydrogenase